MKILIAADDFPWPSAGGGMIRLAMVVDAVADLGEVDLFCLYDHRRDLIALPPSVQVSRLKTVAYPGTPSERRWRADWLAHRGVPFEVSARVGDHGPRRAFEAWTADDYDVVWFDAGCTYEWTGRPRLGPTIVDLDSLEDEKARVRAQILWAERAGKNAKATARQALAAAQSYLNARDWRAFQRSVAADVECAVLCMDLDVERSRIPNAVAVPNAFARPDHPVGRVEVGDPPVILFQGSLNYPPNIDAAEWLVEEIAPRVRKRFPDAQVRLVGKPTPQIKRMHRPPEVTVVGRAPHMAPELAKADVAVVPLRYGSGTRLKILESFAHRIPCVSTTLGAEGYGARHDVELLMADDADAFAEACGRLLTETDTRKRLVDAAEQLYLDGYEGTAARDRIREVVLTTAKGRAQPGRPTAEEPRARARPVQGAVRRPAASG